jgi:hypothetical protein
MLFFLCADDGSGHYWMMFETVPRRQYYACVEVHRTCPEDDLFVSLEMLFFVRRKHPFVTVTRCVSIVSIREGSSQVAGG